jgi:hypothetical protein
MHRAAFNIPVAAPPKYPVNAPTATPAREQAHATNLAKQKAWNIYLVTATITHDHFAAVIKDIYYAALDDPKEGLNAIPLWDLVAHIQTTYMAILQSDVDNNMTAFHTGIDPALPLAAYTCKQENCQTFVLDAGIPISEATMVLTSNKTVINYSSMEPTWRKWHRCPAINQMWKNWKMHWTAAFLKSRDIKQITAGNHAFANQAITNKEQATRMVTILDNLANAAIQKNNTIDKLRAANKHLAKALLDANAAIAHLCFPTARTVPATTAASAGTNNRPCPAHWTPIKPKWDQIGYCWTHGYKVKVGHSSTSCTCQRHRHNTTTTHTKTKGGSTNNQGWSTPPT